MSELKSIEENCRIGAKAGPSILSLSGFMIPCQRRSCLNSGKNANCGSNSTQHRGLEPSGKNTTNALIFAFKNGWTLA
jgi:hypothetical protein